VLRLSSGRLLAGLGLHPHGPGWPDGITRGLSSSKSRVGATLPDDVGKDQDITTETMVGFPEPQGAASSKQAK